MPFLLPMIRRPPRSTLFPYRRSSDLPAEERLQMGAARDRLRREIRRLRGGKTRRANHDLEAHDLEAEPGDRKSTRLNSSHVEISYAVFCLKKKNRIGRERGLVANGIT